MEETAKRNGNTKFHRILGEWWAFILYRDVLRMSVWLQYSRWTWYLDTKERLVKKLLPQ